MLKADAGELGPAYADEQIKEALEVSLSTIQRTRKIASRTHLRTDSEKASKSSRPEKFDGEKEAPIALVCSEAPAGFSRWTPVVGRENGRTQPFFECFS